MESLGERYRGVGDSWTFAAYNSDPARWHRRVVGTVADLSDDGRRAPARPKNLSDGHRLFERPFLFAARVRGSLAKGQDVPICHIADGELTDLELKSRDLASWSKMTEASTYSSSSSLQSNHVNQTWMI